MSIQGAGPILSRMHLNVMAVAANHIGLAADLQCLMGFNPEQAERAFAQKRVELCANFGLDVGPNKPFAFSAGLAIIPIHGTLINRFGYSYSSVTGYNFIRQQTAMAGVDPDVKGIVFDHSTFGGEGAGCFECAQDLPTLAAGKPTLAIIDPYSFSAGYAQASVADRIVMTPSGGVGSIGVVVMHISLEKALADFGIQVTFIHGGAHKVDGNMMQNLPADVQKRIQANVDHFYGVFTGHVAKYRKLDEKAVRDTEAATFRADEALSLGLIDAVAPPIEAVRAFLGELSGSKSSAIQLAQEQSMSDQTTQPGANAATETQLSEARKAERARVSGILALEEAKGRETLANQIATNTELTVDQAKAMLAAAPKVGAANALQEAMESTTNPKVGADNTVPNAPGSTTGVQAVIAAAKAAGLRGYEFSKTA